MTGKPSGSTAPRPREGSPGSRRFPCIDATNLAGHPFALPGDLEGELNLVLVSFRREQGELSRTWSRTLPLLERRFPELRCYKLPTISRGSPPSRSLIDRGMRRGIPDRATRERTITVYVDKESFRRALGLPHEDTIYALLLDGEGTVLWGTEGGFSREKLRRLEEAILGARARRRGPRSA